VSADMRDEASTPSWRLVSFDPDHTGPRVGAQNPDGQVVTVDVLASEPDLLSVVRRWDEWEAVLRNWQPDWTGARPAGRLLAPLRYPAKLLAVGANYWSHMEEMGIVPGGASVPYFFFKPPTTTVIGPDEVIVVSDAAQRPDWEAEVAVVIGRSCRHVEPSEALKFIAGYTLVNDVSARGVHRRESAVGEPFVWDWLASKGQDTFCPMGPGITPGWMLPDPQRIEFELRVNGVLKQHATTADMVVGVTDLVAAASDLMTLEPGDVIATGTPAGVGVAHHQFLGDGDVVEIYSAQLGMLCNPVQVGAERPLVGPGRQWLSA